MRSSLKHRTKPNTAHQLARLIAIESNGGNNTGNKLVINLANSKLRPGIYFLVVKTAELNQVIKFLKE